MKNQLILFPQGFELLQIFPTEHFGNDLNGKEEVFSFIFPLIIRGQASAEQNGMDMGMEVHLRSPCVEDEDIANFCAEMSGVFRQFPDRCGCRMIESIIKELLITVNDRIQKIRNGKNQMEIGRIKNIFPAGIHPFFLRNCLTHGTAAVTAGIIMDLDSAAVFTDTDICAIRPCFTVYNVPGGFCLLRGRGVFFKICRIKAMKDILYGRFIHGQHLLSGQMGSGSPSEICC